MATVKIVLYAKAKKDQTHPIKIKIGHKSSFAELSTPYSVRSSDFAHDRIKSSCKTIDNIRQANNNLNDKVSRAWEIIDKLDSNNLLHTFTARQLRDYIENGGKKKKAKNTFFLEYFEGTIHKRYKGRTLIIYRQTLVALQRFTVNDVLFKEVNKAWLYEFKNWRLNETTANTVNIDLRNIRAVFNYAIDVDEVVNQGLYPFRRFEFCKPAPRNLHLTAEQIIAIRDFKTSNIQLQRARDFFMISFYLIGMNTTDIYNLKKADVRDTHINYIRQKTGKPYSVKVEVECQQLFDKYATEGPMLLSFSTIYSSADNITRKANEYLKKIGANETINTPNLIMYHARHTWAGIAGRKPIHASKHLVAQALGHGRTTVTDTYYDYDNELVDDLNRRVLDLIK